MLDSSLTIGGWRGFDVELNACLLNTSYYGRITYNHLIIYTSINVFKCLIFSNLLSDNGDYLCLSVSSR